MGQDEIPAMLGKVIICSRTGHKGPEGEWRYNSSLSLTSALDGGGLLTPRSYSSAAWNDPVPIV